MSLREIIIQLIQIAIFFAFPAIWGWIITYLPWWPLDPQSTLNILIFLAVTVASWLLGYWGIKKFVATLQAKGLATEVTS